MIMIDSYAFSDINYDQYGKATSASVEVEINIESLKKYGINSVYDTIFDAVNDLEKELVKENIYFPATERLKTASKDIFIDLVLELEETLQIDSTDVVNILRNRDNLNVVLLVADIYDATSALEADELVTSLLSLIRELEYPEN